MNGRNIRINKIERPCLRNTSSLFYCCNQFILLLQPFLSSAVYWGNLRSVYCLLFTNKTTVWKGSSDWRPLPFITKLLLCWCSPTSLRSSAWLLWLWPCVRPRPACSMWWWWLSQCQHGSRRSQVRKLHKLISAEIANQQQNNEWGWGILCIIFSNSFTVFIQFYMIRLINSVNKCVDTWYNHTNRLDPHT